jgi:hypothetical protein
VIHWLRVVRDAIGIALLVGVGGVVVGSWSGVGKGAVPMPTVAVSNFVLSLIGFVIAGALTREMRGRHLWIVALGVWVLGLSSVLLLGISFGQWLASGLAIFVACLLGGAVSAALFPARPEDGQAG